jgi:hypothetical protein
MTNCFGLETRLSAQMAVKSCDCPKLSDEVEAKIHFCLNFFCNCDDCSVKKFDLK